MSVHRVSPWEPPRSAEGGSSDRPGFRDFVSLQRFQPTLGISPDGRTVAYSMATSGRYNLWLQPIAGGTARQLTHFTREAVRTLAWTPDGRSLIFTADRDGDEQ